MKMSVNNINKVVVKYSLRLLYSLVFISFIITCISCTASRRVAQNNYRENNFERETERLRISDFLSYEEPLEAAVKLAKPGSTIIIDADVYHRNNKYIEITKELTLKGVNNSTIYINNEGNPQTGPFVYAHGNNDFCLRIQDVTIDGMRYGKDGGADRNRLFEIVQCDFILKNCVVQNMHYNRAYGIGGQSEFISVLKYNYCEISDCIFRRLNTQIEGIYLKPVYDLYENDNGKKEVVDANNHRKARDFAYIHNNKFLADTKFDNESFVVSFADPNEYVSSWLGIFCGRCEFSNNYVSGSAGSSVHLHVYDSKIEGNTFMPTLNSGVSVNMNEYGFPYGFIPYNDTIRNNTFKNANDCIQCDYAHDIIIENNIYERLYNLPPNDKRSNRFLVMCAKSPYYSDRYITNFTVRTNQLHDIRNFIEWNQKDLVIDKLTIEANNVKLADEYNRGMIDFDFVPSISNVTIKNNVFDFGAYVYLGKAYSVRHIQEPSLISYGLNGKQKIKKIIIEDNVFKSKTKNKQFASINYRNFLGESPKTVQLPEERGVVVRNNTNANGESLKLK